MSRLLSSGILRSAEIFPDRPALEIGDRSITYRELLDQARRVAAVLARVDSRTPLTAVYAYRSETAFVGVLAALLRGHGYVPLNRTFPVVRTAKMLAKSECEAIVVDAESAVQLPEVLAGSARKYLLILPDAVIDADLRLALDGHDIVCADELPEAGIFEARAATPGDVAYLLFTSGSTGDPKGVMVAHRNVVAFIDAVIDRYGLNEEDRLSQTFDMTFDLSVFDMFIAWERGACVCCPSAKALIHPGRFIRDKKLTIWFSVPSTGVFMRRLGALKPGSYPDLRYSLFCGEPLPVEVARAWQSAAPNSAVENLYGPTEVTIACTVYRWDDESSPGESLHGVVPIGEPLPGMSAMIAGVDLQSLPDEAEGELLMSGPQVTPGYWRDPERTAAAFVVPPGRDAVHYRTGDRVTRRNPSGQLLYLGRVDQQIQVLGHRVELGEIEAVLREESGQDAVIALGWPLTVSGASGVVVFIGADTLDVESVLAEAARRLPDYMVPRAVYLRSSLPLNSNGKFDRRALLEELKEMQ